MTPPPDPSPARAEVAELERERAALVARRRQRGWQSATAHRRKLLLGRRLAALRGGKEKP